MLSVVIPAHNEEAQLPGTLAALRAALAELAIPHEIIVSSDSSTDGTARIAREAGARVVEVEVRQIAGARNAGARVASGDVLLFVDADTRVPTEPLRQAMAALEGGAIGGGALIDFDGEIPLWARVFLPAVMLVFRTFRYCGGCFLFCRREAFESVGGFDERYYASEEIHLAKALKRLGRFEIVRANVVTSGRKVRSHSGFEILRMLLAFAARPGSVRKRERLDLWYGPRARHEARVDPGS